MMRFSRQKWARRIYTTYTTLIATVICCYRLVARVTNTREPTTSGTRAVTRSVPCGPNGRSNRAINRLPPAIPEAAGGVEEGEAFRPLGGRERLLEKARTKTGEGGKQQPRESQDESHERRRAHDTQGKEERADQGEENGRATGGRPRPAVYA